jgi:hypothetical protein
MVRIIGGENWSQISFNDILVNIQDLTPKNSKNYLDFDVGYAALSDPHMKDVIAPDQLYREFRNYHFPS